MSGITSTTALWYASRATGVVCLVLLSAVMIIGMLVNRQGRLPGLPKFAVVGLHRNLSLLTVAFLAVHVLTAVADSFVSISLTAAVVPFVPGYKSLWMGLGAVSLDLMAAAVATSLLRRFIGRRVWRAVHWLAYVCWPVAVGHSIGSSTDLRHGPFLALTIICILAVVAALAWRLARSAAAARARGIPGFPEPAGAAARQRRETLARAGGR